MRKRRLVLALLLGCALFALPRATSAQTYTGGCFYCKFVAPTGNAAYCQQVGDNENGDGIQCTQQPGLGWPAGPTCYTIPNPCTNFIVHGGGGGSIGGGGGGGCQRGAGGVCEAECFSCGGGQQQ